MDKEQLVLGGLALLITGWLGFKGNPVRTLKISIILLPLLYAYFFYKWDEHEFEFLLWMAGGVLSVMASAEIIISSSQRRHVKWTMVRAALTICTVLTIAALVFMIPERFYSVVLTILGIVLSAVIIGPSACLAAALWIGMPGTKETECTDLINR